MAWDAEQLRADIAEIFREHAGRWRIAVYEHRWAQERRAKMLAWNREWCAGHRRRRAAQLRWNRIQNRARTLEVKRAWYAKRAADPEWAAAERERKQSARERVMRPQAKEAL